VPSRRKPARCVPGGFFNQLRCPRTAVVPSPPALHLLRPLAVGPVSQDPRNLLVRTALEALAGEPVRVVATSNRDLAGGAIEVPDNAVLVDWLSYSQVMPQASLVICHGGHGTVARALAAGVPVLATPAVGDMAETAARISWAGVGSSVPWRLCRPRPLRWAAQRLLGDRSFAVRAGELAAWAEENDGAERGAELVEQLALSHVAA